VRCDVHRAVSDIDFKAISARTVSNLRVITFNVVVSDLLLAVWVASQPGQKLDGQFSTHFCGKWYQEAFGAAGRWLATVHSLSAFLRLCDAYPSCYRITSSNPVYFHQVQRKLICNRGGITMIRILAILLLAGATTAFAKPPQGCNENANVNSVNACNPNTPIVEEFATVPSPGTLALMALGVSGIVVSWRNRK
jgi:hypothetical protein